MTAPKSGIEQPVLIVELERIYQQVSSINRKLKRIQEQLKEARAVDETPSNIPF